MGTTATTTPSVNLQTLYDATPDGGVMHIPPGDYFVYSTLNWATKRVEVDAPGNVRIFSTASPAIIYGGTGKRHQWANWRGIHLRSAASGLGVGLVLQDIEYGDIDVYEVHGFSAAVKLRSVQVFSQNVVKVRVISGADVAFDVEWQGTAAWMNINRLRGINAAINDGGCFLRSVNPAWNIGDLRIEDSDIATTGNIDLLRVAGFVTNLVIDAWNEGGNVSLGKVGKGSNVILRLPRASMPNVTGHPDWLSISQ